MKRRDLIIALGATGAASAAAVGSGAFTSVEAERMAEVQVVSDEDAYLSLAPTGGPNGGYAEERPDGTLEVVMNDENGDLGGDGVNPEAATVAEEVFEIQNQGTQDIVVDFEGPNGDPVVFPEEGLFVFLLPDDASLPFPLELNSGDSQTMSVVVAAFDQLNIPTSSPNSEYTIIAEVDE